MAEKEILIYTRNNCMPCAYTKELLRGKGVKFKQRNIDQHDKYREEAIALGAAGVPIVLVDGEIYSVGFKPEELKKL